MSGEYASYSNVLYEICNEPNGGTSWSDIKNYANEIIPIIKNNDADAVIIVGTPNWSQYVNQAAADPITGYDNIMYALHFYAATHKSDLRQTMTNAINQGLPVLVSEYGICDASGNGAIDEAEADAWVSTMDSLGVSYIAWNLSNKAETSAIISSSCSKTSGLTTDDLSASGKWLYEMLTGK
jgi:endoglucanase